MECSFLFHGTSFLGDFQLLRKLRGKVNCERRKTHSGELMSTIFVSGFFLTSSAIFRWHSVIKVTCAVVAGFAKISFHYFI